MSARVLITGLSSYLGGRLAQVLERDDDVQAIVGLDTSDPQHQLERTEFVRVQLEPGLLRRIIGAAAIDTVIDTRLAVDPLSASLGQAREVNVVGTRNLLAACEESKGSVRRLIFKSSAHYYGCESDAPAFLDETMQRTARPRNAIERDVVEAEGAVAEFAERNPRIGVTVLRFADVIGGDPRASHQALLSLPVVPSILGFDPRWQLIHEDDVVDVLAHAARNEIPGTYNAAADGVLVLSEVVSLLGKTPLPILPPWGTGFAAAQLRRLGVRVPVELLRQLRYGRGLDNRRLKATGYQYRYTTREAILKLRAQQRLRPLLGAGAQPYRYEREVEEFLRRSPSVQSAPARGASGPGAPGPGDRGSDDPREASNGPPFASYDQLGEAEVIGLIASLEPDALAALRSYEDSHRARGAVLEALDRTLERRGMPGAPR
jgi:UDP-glucose 4-epimerase